MRPTAAQVGKRPRREDEVRQAEQFLERQLVGAERVHLDDERPDSVHRELLYGRAVNGLLDLDGGSTSEGLATPSESIPAEEIQQLQQDRGPVMRIALQGLLFFADFIYVCWVWLNTVFVFFC